MNGIKVIFTEIFKKNGREERMKEREMEAKGVDLALLQLSLKRSKMSN